MIKLLTQQNKPIKPDNWKKIVKNYLNKNSLPPPIYSKIEKNFWNESDKSMFGKKGEEGINDLKIKKNFEILPRYANSDLLGFQDYICEIFIEVLRVLKPGAHALVWAIPRTSHHTAMGLERAGFEIRDCISHVFGQGFPKSLNIGKVIDKQKGLKREVVGIKKGQGNIPNDRGNWGLKTNQPIDITIPNSDEAKQWEGWGTALKPAVEFWWLIRKPIEEKTITTNVLKYGTGGINIDACRIGTIGARNNGNSKGTVGSNSLGVYGKAIKQDYNMGRFPSNFIIDCICDKVIEEDVQIKKPSEVKGGIFSPSQGKPAGKTYKGGKKIHTDPNCPCYILDQQSGINKSKGGKSGHTKAYQGGYKQEYYGDLEPGFNDIGGASRFYYNPKASKSERNKGCEDLEEQLSPTMNMRKKEQLRLSDKDKYNTGTIIKPPKNSNSHPTVKSLSLMRYLITLITPKGGIVIDPFMGSGSTGVAAKELGFNFIGIEKNDSYFKIAEKRINNTKEIEKGLF